MKITRFFCSALVLSIGLLSCSSPRPFDQYSAEFRALMLTEEGFFRGMYPGMSITQVKAHEKWTLKDEEKNYLFYEQFEKTGNMHTLELNFNEQGLNEIKLDAYFVSSEEARTLFNELKTYYKERFGESEDYYGFSGWSVDFNDINYFIELTDESAEYRQGKISLLIYEYTPEPVKKPQHIPPPAS